MFFQTLIETASNDEDDVVELLNAISAANENVSPPTIQSKPKLHKRNTDAQLSSLLENLEPPSSPPESVASADPREFDSQWESPYSDSDASPSKESTKSWRELRGSYHGRSTSEASSDRHSVDQASSKHLPLDSVTEEIAVSTNIDLSSCDDEKDDDDMNTDDDDVFDMLRDKSQLVIGMLNNSNPPPSETVIDENEGKMESHASDISLEVMDTLPDGPPPIPTTPLPSDDDEPPFKPPPRRESLPRFSENDFYQGDVDAEVHAMNGSISRHDRLILSRTLYYSKHANALVVIVFIDKYLYYF